MSEQTTSNPVNSYGLPHGFAVINTRPALVPQSLYHRCKSCNAIIFEITGLSLQLQVVEGSDLIAKCVCGAYHSFQEQKNLENKAEALQTQMTAEKNDEVNKVLNLFDPNNTLGYKTPDESLPETASVTNSSEEVVQFPEAPLV